MIRNNKMFSFIAVFALIIAVVFPGFGLLAWLGMVADEDKSALYLSGIGGWLIVLGVLIFAFG